MHFFKMYAKNIYYNLNREKRVNRKKRGVCVNYYIYWVLLKLEKCAHVTIEEKHKN